MDDLLVQKNALYKGPPSGPVNQHEPMSRHDEILTKVIAKARVNITNFPAQGVPAHGGPSPGGPSPRFYTSTPMEQ